MGLPELTGLDFKLPLRHSRERELSYGLTPA